MAAKKQKSRSRLIYVLNGPNLNLLGMRQPETYGHTTLAQLETMLLAHARGRDLKLVFHQSNHEGDIIDWLHEARAKADGVILNAGAYTHTSVAIHDALLAVEKPIIEVHISSPHSREKFRHHSYVAPVAKREIAGLGVHGYVLALDALAYILKPGV